MKTYIALLRGINVGGNNKISMPELKVTFEECGFVDVKTYINSGNVIFSSSLNADDIKRKCEFAITDRFTFEIPVAILSSVDFIFWSAPLTTFSKTRWSKVAGTSIYQNITIRNANTTKKLLQLTG